MAFNPATVGSYDGMQFNASYRAQWTKIDGAPNTLFISGENVSKMDKYGYGGMLYRDAVGPVSQYGIYGAYAYRFHIRGNSLALGLQGGLSYYKTDWASLTAYQQGDVNAFSGTQTSTIAPNFGLGIYFQGKNVTAGFSAPHLVNNNMNKKAEVFLDNQYYLNVDYNWKFNKTFALQPAMLLKFSGKTAQLDLDAYLVFIQSIWVGAGYRTDNSASFSFQYEFTKNRNTFHIGYAYDLGNSAYRSTTGGTHEIVLSYRLAKAPYKVPGI